VNSTFFALMAEFGTAEIELEKVCKKYFGLEERKAKQRAASCELPVPAYRGGSQKSTWLVSASELAEYLDTKKTEAKENWKKMNSAA